MNRYEEFEALYKPVNNHLAPDAPLGKLFETFGAEEAFVLRQNGNYVWTVIDSNNDRMWIVPGIHYVNRFGYFVCELPWHDPDQEFVYTNDEELDA